MIRKKVWVNIQLSTDDLLHAIKCCGALDGALMFRGLTELMTDESLAGLRSFVGDEEYQVLVRTASDFAQRVQQVAAATGGE